MLTMDDYGGFTLACVLMFGILLDIGIVWWYDILFKSVSHTTIKNLDRDSEQHIIEKDTHIGSYNHVQSYLQHLEPPTLVSILDQPTLPSKPQTFEDLTSHHPRYLINFSIGTSVTQPSGTKKVRTSGFHMVEHLKLGDTWKGKLFEKTCKEITFGFHLTWKQRN